MMCMAVALLLFTSCSDGEELTPVKEGDIIYPSLSVGVNEMAMTAMSRAMSPMSPDEEKYVRTMAIFEFDNEGLHERRNTTYHFINFVNGTVDGNTGVGDVDKTEFGIVETTLNGLAFEARSNGTICFVANVTRNQVEDFYKEYREEGQSVGRTTLDQFKKWALPFEYYTPSTTKYDESVTGHLKVMYMFGYYQGNIVPADIGALRVDLGRMASRLDITIVNETGKDIDKRFGYHFENVCHSAFFFPILSGMPPTEGAGLSRTVICAGDDPVEGDDDTYQIVPRTFANKASHTRYFYAAAHSANGEEDATKLRLFHDKPISDEDIANTVSIPLCNVHPDEAAKVKNGYSLSRNTRYHFTIRVRSSAAKAASRSVEYGGQPGDIIVYLPE